jgi:hypothetical protein
MKTIGMLLLAVTGFAMAPAWAEDSPALRAAAAERYLRVAKTALQYDDMLAELSQRIPAARRDESVAMIKKSMPVEVVTRITRDAVVKVYSAQEINALADFYESPLGVSVMKKMPKLMSEMMPAIQREVLKALMEMQQSEAARGAR